jgi:hypothetical protein
VGELFTIEAIIGNNHPEKNQLGLDDATNQLVENIEKFEIFSMPPDLSLALIHRDCN